MVDLPHRFVPTSCKLISPIRIVAQYGHDSEITAIAFSPCVRFFASADITGCVKIWSVETLDILGSYLIDFTCTKITWEKLDDIVCASETQQRRIEFMPDDDPIESPSLLPELDQSRVIRLLGEPEFESFEDNFVVKYNEQTFRHDLPRVFHVEMDPCERYVVAIAPKSLMVVSAFEDAVLIRLDFAGEDTEWLDFHISSRGDRLTAISRDGGIWSGDPIKQTCSRIYKNPTSISAYDFGADNLIIFGNVDGNIAIYDVPNHAIMLRTPRRPKGFEAVFPSPDTIGLLALRQESATAFLGNSKEILSAAPLPSDYQAACAGSGYAQIIVACGDHCIYLLKLNENEIYKICRIPETETVSHLAYAGQHLLVRLKSGKYLYHNGEKLTELRDMPELVPEQIAISENGKNVALAGGNQIIILDTAGKKTVQKREISNVGQIIFGKDKTVNSLFIFKTDLTIHTMDAKTGELCDLNRLALDYGHVLSIAPAAKSFVFVLTETEHGQLAVFKVGLNTGKSSIALRIFTVGTQIWAAAVDDQTINVRQDTTCLRIIAGLKAYSMDDWSRSEPFFASY